MKSKASRRPNYFGARRRGGAGHREGFAWKGRGTRRHSFCQHVMAQNGKLRRKSIETSLLRSVSILPNLILSEEIQLV